MRSAARGAKSGSLGIGQVRRQVEQRLLVVVEVAGNDELARGGEAEALADVVEARDRQFGGCDSKLAVEATVSVAEVRMTVAVKLSKSEVVEQLRDVDGRGLEMGVEGWRACAARARFLYAGGMACGARSRRRCCGRWIRAGTLRLRSGSRTRGCAGRGSRRRSRTRSSSPSRRVRALRLPCSSRRSDLRGSLARRSKGMRPMLLAGPRRAARRRTCGRARAGWCRSWR